MCASSFSFNKADNNMFSFNKDDNYMFSFNQADNYMVISATPAFFEHGEHIRERVNREDTFWYLRKTEHVRLAE